MEVFFLRQDSLFCKDIWKSFLPFDIFQNAYFWDNMSTNGSAFWQHLHYFLLKNEYPIFDPLLQIHPQLNQLDFLVDTLVQHHLQAPYLIPQAQHRTLRQEEADICICSSCL